MDQLRVHSMRTSLQCSFENLIGTRKPRPRGLDLPPLRVGGVAVAVLAATGDGGRTSFEMPKVDYGRRIADKPRDKVEQARRSRAQWLLVDWLDHLWHMTAWGARPLTDKARDVTLVLRGQLRDQSHIRGIVITDGAVLTRRDVAEQTTELHDGAMAICRQVDRWHAREAVIIPLCGSATPAASSGSGSSTLNTDGSSVNSKRLGWSPRLSS
jgi:hypothetical protein